MSSARAGSCHLVTRPRRVLFRVDAGPSCGLGHLQRSIALAQALSCGGEVRCAFVVIEDAGVSAQIRAAGFQALPAETPRAGSERDLEAVLELLDATQSEAVIVDSYGARAEYFEALRASGRRVAAIDDEARFAFPCHWVINGSPDAARLGYRSSSGDTRFLLGAKYALLRQTFWDLAPRKPRARVQRILLTVGGGDPNRQTPRLFAEIDALDPDFSIDVVIGPFARDTDFPRSQAKGARHPTRVLLGQWDLCAVLREADIAVSGGGQTLCELAAAGTPSVGIEIATNQRTNLQALERLGATRIAGASSDPDLASHVGRELRRLLGSRDLRARMSGAGPVLLDGRGAQRVAQLIVQNLVRQAHESSRPRDLASSAGCDRRPASGGVTLDSGTQLPAQRPHWTQGSPHVADEIAILREPVADAPRILLVLNHLERELNTLERIRQALLRCDPTCRVETLAYRDERFCARALELEPQVIFTFPITSISTATPHYVLKFMLGCHLVCYRREGLLAPGHDWMVEASAGFERYGPDLVDYELFWGEELANKIGGLLVQQSKLASPERIRVFGYPDYEEVPDHSDSVPQASNGGTQLLQKLRGWPRTHTVLCVTGFQAADYSDDDLRRAGDWYDPTAPETERTFEEVRESVRRTRRLRQLWIEMVDTLAVRNRDLHLVLKTHPVENAISQRRAEDPYHRLQRHDNVTVVSDPVPIGQLLACSGLLLHYGSTTAADAALHLVPAVFVRSDEVLGGRPPQLTFYDRAFPSSADLEIREVPAFVRAHLRCPVQFHRTPEMDDALQRHFNFSYDRPYTPSADMAEFLLGLARAPARTLAVGDPLLVDAIRTCGRAAELVTWALSRGIELVKRERFSEALANYLDPAAVVSRLASLQVHDLQMLRSLCLARSRKPPEVTRARDISVNSAGQQATSLKSQGSR